MSAAALRVSFHEPVLAWSSSPVDEARYRRIQATLLALLLLLLLISHLLPPPRLRTDTPTQLSAPMAQLLLENRTPPKPVTPPPKPEKLDKAEKPAEEEAAKPTPAEKPTPREGGEAAVTPARNPIAGRDPGEAAVQAARRKVSGVGLLAMRDSLAELHGAPAGVQLNPVAPGPGVGTGVGVGVGAGTQAGIPDRALITAGTTTGSGGVSSGSVSRDTGGGGLAGRSTTMVEGVAGGGGGGGPGGGGKGGSGGGTGTGVGSGSGPAGAKGGTVQRAGGGKSSRSLEDIRLVFERNKGAIYAIYNRALREDASLQGKVVLELKISPTGAVESVRIVSSELKAPELEQKLLARIRQFDFGAKEVEPMVVSWPLDFLPS